MTDRTIELSIDPDTMVAIATITGNAELFKAIGYLSQWNLSMAKVRILGGVYYGSPELTATYWRHEGDRTQPIAYQIGAVWHEGFEDARTGETHPGYFSFHS